MNLDIEKFQTDAVNAPTVPAINQLKLKNPIYAPLSAYGHFGRDPGPDGSFSWEKVDKKDIFSK